MVFNSWEKILEELPMERPETRPTIQEEEQIKGAEIISQFIDISTSSDKLFEDISLKKIKKLASGRVGKEVIAFVLEKVGWNRSHAAKILKISYKALLYKMEEFEVNSSLEDKTPNRGLRRN